MMPPSLFSLFIDGFAAPWRVVLLAGRERVHEPFSFELTCERPRDAVPLALDTFLARPARLSWPTGEGGERVVSGFLDAAEAVHDGYRFTLAPHVAELADEIDHRVFLGKDAATIAEEVLSAHHLRVERRLTRALPARAQCVQHFESALGFVSRILADEGIAWWLKPSDEETLIFSDNASAHEDIAGESTLRVAEGAGLTGEETVARVQLRAGVVSDKVSLRDYDFEQPSVDLTAEAAEEAGHLEVYAYPGGYADPAIGRALARIRLEEARSERLVLRAETSCRRLIPGHLLTLTHGARDDINQRWLLIDVAHVLGEHGYVARFTAVPASKGYRPARLKSPRLGGVQTATAAGPAGAELHTEEHGRVRAKLRWDRRPERDERASHWLRVAQPPTSGGLLLPRAGWELLVGFSGSSADAPFVLGRLANGEAPPPEGLPARKVVSALGSLTTPNGGSGNVLRLDDSAGAEAMGFTASGDYNERTENDKGTSVTGDDVRSIGANHIAIVGIAHAVSVKGAQTYAVGGDRDVTTVGDLSIGTATESVSVGGLRSFQVGGDYETTAASLVRSVGALKAEVAIQEVNRHVSGVSTVAVGGSWAEIGGLTTSVSVLGASTLTAGGPMTVNAKDYALKASLLSETYAAKSISAKAKRVEVFGASAKYAVGAAMRMKGAVVSFKAASKITLKASGATITITPSAIKIRGAFDSTEPSIVTGKDKNE